MAPDSFDNNICYFKKEKMSKEFTINPIKQTVKVKGFKALKDGTYSLDDFRQICFQNGWEGTLYKLEMNLKAVEDAMWEACK